jgi:hypothetical protein
MVRTLEVINANQRESAMLSLEGGTRTCAAAVTIAVERPSHNSLVMTL